MSRKVFILVFILCLGVMGILSGCDNSEKKEAASVVDSEIYSLVENTKEHHEAMISMIEVIANESTTIDGINELYDYLELNSDDILEDYNDIVRIKTNCPDELKNIDGLDEYIDVSTQYVHALCESNQLFKKYVTTERMNALSGVSDDTNIEIFREMLTIFTEDMPKLERDIEVAREEFLNNAGFSENEIEEIVENN